MALSSGYSHRTTINLSLTACAKPTNGHIITRQVLHVRLLLLIIHRFFNGNIQTLALKTDCVLFLAQRHMTWIELRGRL